MKFDFDLESKQWERNGAGSACGFDATSDGYAGDRLSVRWFVGRAAAPATPGETLVIADRPATLSVAGERAQVRVVLNDQMMSVSAFSDNPERMKAHADRLKDLAILLARAAGKLKPDTPPEADAKVDSPYLMSPEQACSLLHASVEDGAVGNVSHDALECTRNDGATTLRITQWATNNEMPLRIEGLPSEFANADGTLSLRSESIDRTPDGTLETVLELSSSGVDDTSSARASLMAEMRQIIAELGRRLPQPLTWEPNLGSLDTATSPAS
jgi:hypothetical protein